MEKILSRPSPWGPKSTFWTLVFLPFNLWLWAVSIPIRFVLFFVFGEFWKWNTRGHQNIKDTPTSGPQRTEARTQPKSIEAERNGLRQRQPEQKAIELKQQSSQKVADIREQASIKAAEFKDQATQRVAEIRSQVEQKVADVKDLKEQASQKVDEMKDFAWYKGTEIKEQVLSFVQPTASASEEVPLADKRIAKITEETQTESASPKISLKEAENQFNLRDLKFNELSTRYHSEKDQLVARNKSLETQLEDVSAKWNNDLSERKKLEEEKLRLRTLIESNQRQLFDKTQEIIALKNHMKHEAEETTELRESYEKLNAKFDDIHEKQKTKRASNKKRVAVRKEEARVEAILHPTPFWHVENKQSYTDMVAEAQKAEREHPKPFAEVLKEAIAEVPATTETPVQEKFAVVGGEHAESTKHLTVDIDAIAAT